MLQVIKAEVSSAYLFEKEAKGTIHLRWFAKKVKTGKYLQQCSVSVEQTKFQTTTFCALSMIKHTNFLETPWFFVGGWYNSFVQWHCTIQKRTWISTEDFKYLQVFFSFCPIFHKIPHSMQCWKLFFSYQNFSKEHQFVTHCSFPIFDTPKFLKSLKLKIYF